MNSSHAESTSSSRSPVGPAARSVWLKLLIALAVFLLALVLIVVFFPWDVLRGPVNRYVTEKSGRHFEITRRLDVHPSWKGATIDFDGVEFANPDWARDPYLVKAERAQFRIEFWPLILSRKVVIPDVVLTAPTVGLQLEEDGRRTWALGKDTSDTGTVPTIGAVQVDHGQIDFLAKHLALDLHADVNFDSAQGELPLHYAIKGEYRKQKIDVEGRAGNVLQLTTVGLQPPFPIEIQGSGGALRLKAKGTVNDLSTFEGFDAQVDVRGQNLGNLYPFIGVALPQTSPYQLAGHIKRTGNVWDVHELRGRLGLSDIGGEMRFDQGPKRPFLSGELRSKVLDMDDLGPLIGLAPTERSAKAIEGVAPPPTLTQVRKQRGTSDKVLPTAQLDFERLRAMNADVKYTADRIRNVREVPFEKGNVHVVLKEGVLTLDPLVMGLAGGQIGGAIRIDGSQNPADIRASLDIRALQLNRLIPKVETLKTSFGKLDGRINLSGRGSSIASWLGASSGDVALMTGRGQFSNLLLEFMGLDGGEIIKFLVKGDHNVTLRCAAVAFDVNKGNMNGRTLVFDTTDTVFNGSGHASLKDETLDFVVKQEPKDRSILSLRTPLLIRGTFASPKPGVEPGPLLARGAAAVALGVINPILALAATIETGPGEDADCKGVLSEAKNPSVGNAAAGAAKAKTAKDPNG